MEYTINKLAKLAGVSTRTLRYYDEFGLLTPVRVSSNGYRIYGQKEIDRLQQILFYRELGVSLEQIKSILSASNFDRQVALEGHLTALRAKRQQIDALIDNVEKTLKTEQGELTMTDDEKFEGFINKLVEDNERQYGAEVREKYGDGVVDRSHAKVRGMSKEQYAAVEKLRQEYEETLKAAYKLGDPAGPPAQKACELHKKWLCYFWDHYSKEAHTGVTQMYVDDPRFTAYYDQIASGCASFLRDAVLIYCK